jgi:hypothetical protein
MAPERSQLDPLTMNLGPDSPREGHAIEIGFGF